MGHARQLLREMNRRLLSDMDTKDLWLENLISRITFYENCCSQKRQDLKNVWAKVALRDYKQKRSGIRRVKSTLQSLGLRRRKNKQCIRYKENFDLLWSARNMFQDAMSRYLFDEVLLLRAVGSDRYFIREPLPKLLLEVTQSGQFVHADLPNHFLMEPILKTRAKFYWQSITTDVSLITNRGFPDTVNTYKQYFFDRDNLIIAPGVGDVVIDGGACLGDNAILFAACTGTKGAVHSFDPVPLHNKFCQLQSELNPNLADRIQTHQYAIGKQQAIRSSPKKDSKIITPGGISVDNFQTITLDSFANEKNLSSVDFIKLDIEGFEYDALQGARAMIQQHKPRLAICLYHSLEDYWRLPKLIKEINPNYELYFDHHSPIGWESVCYAIDKSKKAATIPKS